MWRRAWPPPAAPSRIFASIRIRGCSSVTSLSRYALNVGNYEIRGGGKVREETKKKE